MKRVPSLLRVYVNMDVRRPLNNAYIRVNELITVKPVHSAVLVYIHVIWSFSFAAPVSDMSITVTKADVKRQ